MIRCARTTGDRLGAAVGVWLGVWLGVCLGVSLGLSGCTRDPEGNFAREEPEPVAQDTPGLRFAPTIARAAQAGETVVLLLELTSPSDRRLDAVVGVSRAGATAEPTLAIELWTFDQANKADVLTRVGEPQVLVRMGASGPTAPAMAAFRLRMAVPGANVQRLLGISAPTPAAALERLARAAKLARDVTASAPARIDALALIFSGLDDGVVFERDGLGVAIDKLAAGQWQGREVSTRSERRASVETSGGDTLELLSKGNGWVIATARGR